jgi:hypothetical protein
MREEQTVRMILYKKEKRLTVTGSSGTNGSSAQWFAVHYLRTRQDGRLGVSGAQYTHLVEGKVRQADSVS